MTANTYSVLDHLQPADRERLEAYAPLFDVVVSPLPENQVQLRVLDRGGWREHVIGAESLHVRLLSELCSKTLRWIYYPVGTPCYEALLGLAEARIRRISELYQRQKATLLGLSPETEDEGSEMLAAA